MRVQWLNLRFLFFLFVRRSVTFFCNLFEVFNYGKKFALPKGAAKLTKSSVVSFGYRNCKIVEKMASSASCATTYYNIFKMRYTVMLILNGGMGLDSDDKIVVLISRPFTQVLVSRPGDQDLGLFWCMIFHFEILNPQDNDWRFCRPEKVIGLIDYNTSNNLSMLSPFCSMCWNVHFDLTTILVQVGSKVNGSPLHAGRCH